MTYLLLFNMNNTKLNLVSCFLLSSKFDFWKLNSDVLWRKADTGKHQMKNHQNLELGQTSLIKSHPVLYNWTGHHSQPHSPLFNLCNPVLVTKNHNTQVLKLLTEL